MVGRRSQCGPTAVRLPVWLGAVALLPALAAAPAWAAIFPVDSTGDEAAQGSTSNGNCNSTAGTCTLRAAIEEANGTGGADTITFSIGAVGSSQTITILAVNGALPAIVETVTINAYTQGGGGYTGPPIVQLNATSGGATAALRLEAGSSGSTIRGLVINRSPGYAVRILGSSNNVIAGNYLGTDMAGTGALPNSTGIFIQTGTGNVIGGTTAADRNVISGNSVDGIQISGEGADGNFVRGNYIGVDVNGTADLGNGGQGVVIYLGADTNTIGGTAPGAGNVISGNNNGIAINDASTTGNLVQGNFIGTDWTGTLAVPNNFRGITFDGGSTNNTVGGTVAGAGNTIAYNGSEGVWVSPTVSGIAIEGNSIFSNAGLGIDLQGNGFPEINDVGDVDAGANALQNQPVLSGAMTNGVSATFAGSFDSAASTTYRIEFFANTVLEPTGYGEGKRYLGFTNVTTNASGTATFGVTLTPPVPLAIGEYVTTTATRTVAPLDTSEFGNALLAVGDLVVTTTADGVDGNTGSVSALIANPGGDGRISLREAITATNNTAGAQTIRFGIPLTDTNHFYYRENGVAGLAEVSTTLADVFTPSSTSITDFDADYPAGLARSWYRIQPGSALPVISDAVVLYGAGHPLSNTAGPVVEIVGASLGGSTSCFAVGAAGVSVHGLIINQFPGEAVTSQGASTVVLGNYIGTDPSGTLARGNGTSGFSAAVYVGGDGSQVGGLTAADRNVISGNLADGLWIDADNVSVWGNYIGTDVTGASDLGNGLSGVVLSGVVSPTVTNVTIGGTAAWSRNVISGNVDHGIELLGAEAQGNFVQGNYVGTNATGTAALPNGQHGVYIHAGAAGNTVGGSAAARNVLSGNGGQGVRIDFLNTVNNVVSWNHIGTNEAGAAGVPNNSGGIAITNQAASNTIGGVAAGAGNLIAYNLGGDGINVAAAAGTGNAVLGNAFHSNAGLGIDLRNDGVTSNDTGDGDTGPNSLQNFPVLSAAATDGVGNVHVAGSLNSAASTAYRVEFFASSAPDPTGFGEGERHLGFANVTTNASGNAVIGATLATSLSAGELVTATATDPSNNTSEFSAAVVAVGSLVVTTTANTADGNTASVSTLIASPGADGRISLREAITATNNTGGADTIRFGIPLTDAGHWYYPDNGTGGSLPAPVTTSLADSVSPSSPAITNFDADYPAGFARSWYRIRPTSALPGVTGAVVIDAETQPGFVVGGPVVEIDGSLAGAGSSGLSLTTGPSTVRGLIVNRFQDDGLNLRGPGGFSVTGNYLGTDVSGTVGAGNVTGSGVFITQLAGAPSTIGGSTAATRNVISANGLNGIYVYNYYAPASTQPVRIRGNYIGTDVTGTVGLGVQTRGIVLEYTGGHTIGGSGAGEGNLISGNAGPGIDMNGNYDTGGGAGAPTDNNVIEGNRIGTNAAGTAAIPNAGHAIQMYGDWGAPSASGNTVRGNVIAASTAGGDGIFVEGNADNNLLEGNFIGTDSGGTLDLGNAGRGIYIGTFGAFVPAGNRVRNNLIRFNSQDGVRIVGTGASATLTQNAISSNDALGIDLGGDGVTANDVNVLDADTGPNELMNFPTFATPVEVVPGTLSVNYGLDLAAGWYRIEFFKNPSGADLSRYGEGELFASSVVVDHPGGRAGYVHSFPGNAGNVITATTTACDGALCANPGSTSEFSLAVAAATTAVRLMSFSAVPGDGSVTLEWQTGSEMDNLGFHLHRSLSETGPWQRITTSLIPGLVSSPLGQAYSWLDTGLTNGVRYYYRLEDVDTASRSTLHGPVWAVPSPPEEGGEGEGGGDGTERGSTSCPSWVLAAAPDVPSPICTRHGDPESVSLDLLARDSSSASLELRTGGFWVLQGAAGEVRVFVPGLEFPADPRAPALPLRRALVDAVVGKQVELVSAEAFELRTFPDLRPSAVGAVEMAVGPDGTVRPARRALAAAWLSRGLLPREVARLAGAVFQGERKSAVVEITPVRFNGSRQELVLAGRVLVKLAFTGVAEGEGGTGSRGRALPGKRALFREVLAQMHTSRRGLHAVSYEALFPSRPRGFSTLFLRLQRQGEAVPFHVEPSGTVFGPGSVLYFFADRTASSTDYSSEVAYELVRAPGSQMGMATAAPAGAPVLSPSTATASFETNRIYQPGLLEAPDIWLWDGMASGATRAQAFVLSGVDTSSVETARLVVHLQGGSESGMAADHHVRVRVNGSVAGEATFAGKRAHALEVLVAASLLREGANELAVENAGDTGVHSLVFLDRFEVSYPQVSSVRQGVYEGVWGESGTVEVEGLGGSPVAVILRDSGQPGPEGSAVTSAIAGPSSPGATEAPRDDSVQWLTGFEATGTSVRFQAEAGRRYHVVSAEGLLSPRIARRPVSTLEEASNQADYLVIGPRELLEAAQPLLERRRSQGLSSRAVSFEEIASEFGRGQPSAEAIREFLSYAYHSWQGPSPRYVLLLGDATCDPRRFQPTSWASPLPALWVKTSYLWTASDPALGAVNGEDLLPDVAIGRLPATTPEQAEKLVAKLLDWEDSGQGLAGNAVLVADIPDQGGDFEADVEDVRASFLAERSATTLKVRELGAGTRPAILGAFDEGASLVSYVGHGGTAVWSSANVLNSWDTPSLRAQGRQPLLLTLNCLNGYFVAPNFDALAEALVKAEGRGAIAAVSPSGLSLDGPAHQYHRAVMAEVASGAHRRLGDALLAAQEAYAESGLMPELLAVYQLLGDPATRIR